MSPFGATVFRIRLLLLAAALGLMGFGVDKKDQQARASVSNPTKIFSRQAPSTLRKPQGGGVLVVQVR
jgi:hypothetical protein